MPVDRDRFRELDLPGRDGIQAREIEDVDAERPAVGAVASAPADDPKTAVGEPETLTSTSRGWRVVGCVGSTVPRIVR